MAMVCAAPGRLRTVMESTRCSLSSTCWIARAMRSFSPPAPAPTTNSTFPSGFQAGCACDAVNPAASKKNAAAARRGVLVRMSSSRENRPDVPMPQSLERLVVSITSAGRQRYHLDATEAATATAMVAVGGGPTEATRRTSKNSTRLPDLKNFALGIAAIADLGAFQLPFSIDGIHGSSQLRCPTSRAGDVLSREYELDRGVFATLGRRCDLNRGRVRRNPKL